MMQKSRIIQLALVCLSTLYLYSISDRGWIPHDEGLLGQSAERVIDGQIPHMDFDDTYTGGQAWLHSLSFRVLGVNLYSIRLLLLAFSIPFVAVFYSLTLRFMPAWAAAMTTLLAVAWSTPNYFAALPSWYNLYLATFGIWSLVKYDETRHLRWVFLAGVFGGLSFLFKLSGLYFIAAAMLFLVFHEQETAERLDAGSPPQRLFLVFTSLCLALFSTALVLTVRNRLTLMDGLHFVTPGVILSTYLILNEFRKPASALLPRFKALFQRMFSLISGAMIPVLIFLIPYAIRGGLGDWWQGVFVLPQKRIQWTDYQMPPPETLIAIVPIAILFAAPRNFRLLLAHPAIIAVAVVLGLLAVFAGSQPAVYSWVWNTTRPLVPLLTAVGCVTLLWRQPTDSPRRNLLFLSIASMAMVSLVQFPYAYGIYFCYVAPLVVLTYAVIASCQQDSPIRMHLCVAATFLGFALLWLNHGNVRRIGVQYVAHQQTQGIRELARFGLRTSPTQARLYRDVIREVQKHSSEGEYIYATSDCPEIYFLSGRKNPTKTFYDFFDADFVTDPSARTARIVSLLEDKQVKVVVFHWAGEFSGSPTTEFAQQLVPLFPNVKHFVRDPYNQPNAAPVFSVAWR